MLTERLFRLLFWSAIVFAFVMASIPQPPSLPGNPSDKTLHMLAFFVLASLSVFAYQRTGLVVLFLGLGAFGAAIELVQAVPLLSREASWLDWLADLGASAIGLAGAGALRVMIHKARTSRSNAPSDQP
jgi:VanZ family protein